MCHTFIEVIAITEEAFDLFCVGDDVDRHTRRFDKLCKDDLFQGDGVGIDLRGSDCHAFVVNQVNGNSVFG